MASNLKLEGNSVLYSLRARNNTCFHQQDSSSHGALDIVFRKALNEQREIISALFQPILTIYKSMIQKNQTFPSNIMAS